MNDERRIAGPVSRRTFLGLSALAAAPPALFQTSRVSNDPTVVIGAGLAGLRAADVLRRAGRPVIVLEARERAGGRVVTRRAPFDDGLHAEAGPIRISSAHRVVLQLVRAFRLTLVPFESSIGSSVVSVAGVVDRSPQALAHKLASELKPEERGLSPLELLERYVGKLSSDLADPATTAASYAKWTDYDRLTWPAWLRSRGASPGAVMLMTLGGDAEDVSALYVLRQYALSRSSTQLYKIQGGMDLLPQAMASALGNIVRYNAPVVRVNRSPARLRVDYESSAQVQSVTASHVIFAVPLTTLRQIEIRPRLSARKERGITEATYANGTRILLQCRSRFWVAGGLNGSARTDKATELWDCTYDQRPSVRGILGATTSGPVSREMSTRSPNDSQALGISLAAEAFPAVRTEVEKTVVQQWAAERWSRGSFVAFRPGQMSAIMPDIAQPEDRLHFAGEHTSSWMGWMEGALESGERAAREILASQN
jgi:monoamine oxidase